MDFGVASVGVPGTLIFVFGSVVSSCKRENQIEEPLLLFEPGENLTLDEIGKFLNFGSECGFRSTATSADGL
jgi:hypothetical protein